MMVLKGILKKVLRKEYYIFFIIALFCFALGGVSYAFAQEDNKPLSEQTKSEVVELSEQMSERMFAAANRFLNIIYRIDARMSKLEQAGYDTSEAKLMRDNAHASIYNAVVSLKQLDAVVEETVTSNDPKTKYEGFKAQVTGAQSNIITTHEILIKVIQALKESQQKSMNGS